MVMVQHQSQKLVQERPQVQGALPEWKVGNSEGIHAGS